MFTVHLHRDDVVAEHDPRVERNVVTFERWADETDPAVRGVTLTYADDSTWSSDVWTTVTEITDEEVA